jgi:isocitrate/isopropylmalate dehydrogenase
VARAKKDAQVAANTKDIAEAKAARTKTITAKKAQNREEEGVKLAEIQNVMANGTQWEKVHKLVNLQPKSNAKPGTQPKVCVFFC